MENTTTAQTILNQLGGNKFIAMTGAKNFLTYKVDGNTTLQMRFMKGKDGINALNVTYKPGLDLYEMQFAKLRGVKSETVEKFKRVYAEELKSVFEGTTGLYLSL